MVRGFEPLLPYLLQPFGSVLNLVPLAESVVKLKAVCMVCSKDAAFTKRLGSETKVKKIADFRAH